MLRASYISRKITDYEPKALDGSGCRDYSCCDTSLKSNLVTLHGMEMALSSFRSDRRVGPDCQQCPIDFSKVPAIQTFGSCFRDSQELDSKKQALNSLTSSLFGECFSMSRASKIEAMAKSISTNFSIKDLDVMSERSNVRSSFMPFTVGLEEEALDAEEVSAMEKSISEGVITSMSQFFNKHENIKGIWYPNDYKKYLMDEFDIEMDESFFTGFADAKFFEKIGRFTFKLKEGEKASEALLSFLDGPTVIDCGNATMACYYKCILDIIGEEQFDQIFSSRPFALTIGQEGIAHQAFPISYFADYTDASKRREVGVLGKRPLRVGEECHFAGVIWYGNKHPQGFGGGWNVIYIGDDEEGNQLFMAHGFEKPLTEREIHQKLLENYNRERTEQDELHIAQANNPKWYDKITNRYLISYYTISEAEVTQNTSEFIKGFLVGSVRGLQARQLVKLKNANTWVEFLLKSI